MKILFAVIISACAFASTAFFNLFEDKIDYSTQVKPILNKNCLACHGGVKKQGGFSLLFEEEAFAKTSSGKPAIIRGDAKNSDFIKRLTHKDPEERMPLEADQLSAEDIELLTKWVDQGAEWGEHWAFQKPEMPSVPSVGTFLGRLGLQSDPENDWTQNDIDHFVLDKLKTEGLKPAQKAQKEVLFRRIYLDVIGLAPTEAQVADFMNDKSEKAIENVVDKLLKNKHFGEKWAGMWLDLARYADTKGYERDSKRNIWRYRDYVIKAFNDDIPFDQFTIEQLAGDLLPNPTENQLIATAFHRNTMNNDEGGTVDEEFRVASVLDRINTTFDVWQGTTVSCVQCHSHPYDPIKHDEYYKLMAYFNNARDEDVYSETPYLRFFDKKDSAKILNVKQYISKLPNKGVDYEHFLKTLEPKINSHDFQRFEHSALLDEKIFGFTDGGSCLTNTITFNGKNTRMFIKHGSDPLVKDAIVTIKLNNEKGKVLKQYKVPTKGSFWTQTIETIDLPALNGKHKLHFSMNYPAEKSKFISIDWINFQEPIKNDSSAKWYLDLLNAQTDNHPIMLEGKGDLFRKTHVFERGNWLVHGKEVKPGVPFMMGALEKKAPQNRLGLAQWLVGEENPLTARVMANRIWEQLFGYGIVETVEDFGTQGFTPSHPELLDYLAVTFKNEQKWSVKKLIKLVVLSATYQQSSAASKELLALDPYNKFLTRGPRVRLSAEAIRDQALVASGLFSAKMYGVSVMPKQPDGLWQSPWNGENWVNSTGEDTYRRAIYTYWKRTTPYPTMMTFDTPSREFCQTRRIRTNTPLQALIMLNDPVYLEASIALSDRMKNKSKNLNEQIAYGYKLLMAKQIKPNKLKILTDLYVKSMEDYKKNPESINRLFARTEKKPEDASLALVASTILNLDEAITKE